MIHDFHVAIRELHAVIHDFHGLIHNLHTLIHDFHVAIRDMHRSAEPEIHVMATPIKLRVSLVQFLADADRVAVLLERDGERLSRATGDAVNAATARELRKLVARLREMEARDERPSLGTPSAVKPEVRRLVARVAAAARWVGRTDSVLAARVERLSRECSVRAAPLAALPLALDHWAQLVAAHQAQLADLLGADMGDQLNEKAREIRARMRSQTQTRMDAAQWRRDRNAMIERIHGIVGMVNAAGRLLRLDA